MEISLVVFVLGVGSAVAAYWFVSKKEKEMNAQVLEMKRKKAQEEVNKQIKELNEAKLTARSNYEEARNKVISILERRRNGNKKPGPR